MKDDNQVNKFIVEYYNEHKNYDENFSWKECADEVNFRFDTDLTSDACRKRYYYHKDDFTDVPEQLQIEDSAFQDRCEIAKENFKLSDERVQINAMLRRISREETIKEIAREVAEIFSRKCSKYSIDITNRPTVTNENKEGILQISDWHYGIDINSPYNVYNPDVCRKRVEKLAKEVAQRCALHNIHRLHVVNLGDMIAGRIHLRLRLNSRFDVITQVIEVSEILATFLYSLSTFLDIEYYDTLDNHSRLEPKLSDALDLESLVRIITWFLRERLKDVETIHFNDNVFGDDIASFTCLGHNIIAVHGNRDKPENVVQNLSLMTQSYYDLALTAHRHHFFADEQNRTIVLSNSSLMGTDELAQQLRLSASASQNLIIVTKENVVDTVCRINVE